MIPPPPSITLKQAAALTHPGYVVGRWYWVDKGGVEAGSIGLNALKLSPFVIPYPITVSDLACKIETAAAGGNIQLGIYASDPNTHLASGAPVAVTGNISTTSAVMVSADITGADVALPAGTYWAGIMADNATVSVLGAIRTAPLLYAMIGSTTLTDLSNSAVRVWGTYALAVTFGTWPNLTTTPAANAPNAASVTIAFKVSG